MVDPSFNSQNDRYICFYDDDKNDGSDGKDSDGQDDAATMDLFNISEILKSRFKVPLIEVPWNKNVGVFQLPFCFYDNLSNILKTRFSFPDALVRR